MSRYFFTGERTWTDRAAIGTEIRALLATAPEDLVIVHGDCPTGADAITQELCDELGIPTERFPVVHSVDGPWPGAGPRRNRRAIDSGPLAGWRAFWSGRRERSGTLDALAYATSRGVSGRVVARRTK